MKPETKAKLEDAMTYCDNADKSTEFMIQYMMDYANVPHECVIKFLFTHSPHRPVRTERFEE